MINLFLYGMSGSGKDTLANFFQQKHLYLKFRCAGTIKQIISEKGGMTFAELEERKRKESNIRKAHWTIGDWMGADGSAVRTRIRNILKRQSVEFDMLPPNVSQNPILFCDVRRDFEVEEMLKNGAVGIFLTRTTSEDKHGKHSTEDSILLDERIQKILRDFPNQCVMVFNNGETKTEIFDLIDRIPLYRNALGIVTFESAPNGKTLIETFKNNLETIIPMFFSGNSGDVLFDNND